MMKRIALYLGMCVGSLFFLRCSAFAVSYSASVIDCSGRPVTGNVVLYEVYGVDGSARSRSACTQSLDSVGKFRCDKLTAGRYTIVVSSSSVNASASDTLPIPLMPREALEDGPFRIAEEGQNQRHALHVCAGAAKSITASIADKPPASFINLAFRTPEGDLPTGVSPAYDSESGKVRMPSLTPGTYHLQAYWFSNDADKRYDRILRVPEDTQSELDLQNTVYTVSGSVRIEGGTSPPAGMIIAASCGQFGSMVRRRQLIGSDGTFSFRRLNAPECMFSLDGPSPTEIVSMEVNDKPIEYGRAMLNLFPDVNRVTLTASAARASLSGRVDGKGVEAGIGVVACNLGSGRCHATKTAADGAFRFVGLPVGNYRISAWNDLDRVEYQVPAFVRQFATSKAETQLNGNQSVDVSVSINRVY